MLKHGFRWRTTFICLICVICKGKNPPLSGLKFETFFFFKVRCVKLKLPAILLCQYTITHLTIGFEAYLLWRGDSFSCIQKFGVFHCTHSSYNYFAVFIREFFTRPNWIFVSRDFFYAAKAESVYTWKLLHVARGSLVIICAFST